MKFIVENNGFVLWYFEKAHYNQWIITNTQGLKLLSRPNEREARAVLRKLAKDPNWR